MIYDRLTAYQEYENKKEKAVYNAEIASLKKSNPKYEPPKQPKMPKKPDLNNEFLKFYVNLARIRTVLSKLGYITEWAKWSLVDAVDSAYLLLIN